MPGINPKPFPYLLTERLQLRQLSISDAAEILFLRSDEKVNEFVDRPNAKTIDDAKNFIKKIIVENDGLFYWAIALKNTNTLIGTICLWNISVENNTAEIGYELNPVFQGKGIMQEAVSVVIKFAFEDLKLKAITAFPNIHNEKSIQLLTRNNFILDIDLKYQNEEVLDEYVCYFLESSIQ